MITREFDLMLYQEGNLLFINANQYDSGEQWIFTLYEENGVKYTPATGAIVGVKSDGKGIINTGTVDEYGRVVINETQQMTAAAGLATFELLIDNDTHGTANFKVDVEPRPADNADLSDSDLSLIQEAIDSAEVIVDVIGDSDPSEVIGEHVDAWLDNHPEATTTVQDGAITAPKINNSLWDKLLVSEEASGAVASFDDGADDVPVSSLKVALEPIQLGSGDPSPSNIRPIYPANSGNLFDPNSSGTEWVTSQNAVTTIDVSKSVRVPVVQGQALTLSNDTASSATNILLIAFLNSSNTVLSRTVKTNGDKYVTATAPANAVTAIASFYQWAQVSNAQLELNSSASAYQPYQSIMVKRTGKNRLASGDGYTNRGVTKSVNSDGSVTLTGTATQLVDVSLVSNPVLETGVTYRMVIDKATGWNGTGNVLYATIGNGSTNRYVGCGSSSSTLQTTFTLASDEYVGNCFLRVANGVDTGGQTIKVMIIKDGESTSYEPYQSTSYPYTLGQNVYGGSVDLATGVLTVDRVAMPMESISWQWNASYHIAYAYIADKKPGRTNLWSEMYKTVDKGYADMVSGEITGAGNTGINVRDDRFTALADFVTAVTGSKLMYVLATPTTVQLTPQEVKTLLGYNNILSTGTVDVIYHADTKLYVDKMTAVDNNIIAPTEADFVATRNYTVNDLVIVNDTLYKVTSNIATGSAITPNSNVQQTTLGALIKALS